MLFIIMYYSDINDNYILYYKFYLPIYYIKYIIYYMQVL